jgi:hypothetical protein
MPQSAAQVSGLQSSRHLGRRVDGSPSLNLPPVRTMSQTVLKGGFLQEDSSTCDGDHSPADSFPDREDIVTNKDGAQHLESANLTQPPTSGSGFKRPLELGKDGIPVLKSPKKRQKSAEIEELPWEGFSSEEETWS